MLSNAELNIDEKSDCVTVSNAHCLETCTRMYCIHSGLNVCATCEQLKYLSKVLKRET